MESWVGLGFQVRGAEISLAGMCLQLEAAGDGIVSWRLRGIGPVAAIDGLQTEVGDRLVPRAAPGAPHPNGAIALDHFVVLTPDFDRTARELRAVGMPLRRVRQAAPDVRQGFRRLGPAILELVESRSLEPGPARFWGLVVTVADLDALAVRLGDRLGSAKPAVQTGRQIATLRGSAGLGQPVAFMSPEPRRSSATLG